MSTSSSCDQVPSETTASHYYQPQSDSGSKQQLIAATFPPLIQHFSQSLPHFHTSIVPGHDSAAQRLDSWREVSCQEQPVTGTFVPFVTASEYEQLTRGYQTSIAPWENYHVQGGAAGPLYATQEIPEHTGYEYCNRKNEAYSNYHDPKVTLQEFDVFHPGDILELETPIDQKQETESNQNQSEGQEFQCTNTNDEYIVTSLDDSSASVLPSFCCFEQPQGHSEEQARIGDPGLITRFNYCSFFASNECIKNSYTAI